MAVTTAPPAVRHFVRLKLRMLRNGLRGRSRRVALFVLGALFGAWFAFSGFVLFAAAGVADETGDVAALALSLGGAMVVLGWLFLPLVFFGVDETLDPARFALLPLPRRTLVAGMLAAGLIGIPPVATLFATAGTVISVAALGGWVAATAQAVGVVAGLLLCVAVSRAVTSAFATTLRSRRTRDLAAVILAVLAASIGPIEIGVIAAAEHADTAQLAGIARVISWTPLAAPYTIGLDVAQGRPLWAVAKLIGTALVIWGVLRWWARSLESAMLGAVAPTGRARGGRAPAASRGAGAVAALLPRPAWWLRPDRSGALVAREVRYWWRDARRRAGLITLGVVGVFVPLLINVGISGMFDSGARTDLSPTKITVSMLFVGGLAAVTLANQFGYDGNAYAAHLVIGVPGRTELRSRVTAFSVYAVPLITAAGSAVALVVGRPGYLPAMLGALYAAYGAGLAVNTLVSVLGAYALPETANPFAVNSGTGAAKGLLSMVAIVASVVAALPFAVAAALLGTVWLWLALPAGVAYGVAAAALGCYIGGDVLDRRGPELLATVTPRP